MPEEIDEFATEARVEELQKLNAKLQRDLRRAKDRSADLVAATLQGSRDAMTGDHTRVYSLRPSRRTKPALITRSLTKLIPGQSSDRIKLGNKDNLREVEVYDAETKRISALAKLLPTDPAGLQALIAQAVQDSLQTSIGDIMDSIKVTAQGDEAADATKPSAAEAPPIPGAAKAPDGEWYLTDPTRKGKYLKVAPLAQLHGVPGTNLGAPQ